MAPPGVFPYQRGPGPVDDNTIRVVMAAGGGDPALGSPTDLPAAAPTDATAASMIALLKTLVNQTDGLEISAASIDLSNTAIEMNTDQLEALLGVLATNSVGLETADDKIELVAYLDAGDPIDRRIDTVTVKGVAATPNYVETYGYGGGAGDYYLTSVTRVYTA